MFAGHWCEVQLAENRRRIVVITHGGKNPFRMPFDRRIAKSSKQLQGTPVRVAGSGRTGRVAIASLGTGTLLGFLAANVVSRLSPLPAVVEPWSVVLGISVTAVVGLFFGLYPATRAASLDPIEALRRE